jgi:hypothetical protein
MLDIQTKGNASLPKDIATQKTDQIVPNPSQEIFKPILKLAATTAALATLLQTCAPTAIAVCTIWENYSPEM